MNSDPSTYLRGDIYIATQENMSVGAEIWGNRPAIIVSNDTINNKSNVVNMVYLTTSKNKNPFAPTHCPIQSGNKKAIAMCEQIVSIDKSRLSDKIGHITDEEQKNIDSCLLFTLGISNSIHPSTMFKKWENYINKYHLSITSPMDIFETDEDIANKYENSVLNSQLTYEDSDFDVIIKDLNMYKSLYEQKCKQIAELKTMVSQI